jgi:DNA-binding transcriptional LysR family regulator
LLQQLLLESPLTGLVSKNHSEIGDEITQEQYERVGHVMVISPHGGQIATNRKLESFGLRRKIALQLSSFTAYATILQSTGYISIIPAHIGTVLAKHGDLKLVKLPFELQPIAFRQYWHSRQDSDLGHRWLRQLISTLKVT